MAEITMDKELENGLRESVRYWRGACRKQQEDAYRVGYAVLDLLDDVKEAESDDYRSVSFRLLLALRLALPEHMREVTKTPQ
jgi:hypothetical protein